MSEVLDKVVEIVCNQLSVNKEDVTPMLRLLKILEQIL